MQLLRARMRDGARVAVALTLTRNAVARIALAGIALVAIAPAVRAQGGGVTISGRVTTEQGAPLPGASVFLQGLSIGSQTNDQGNYTFVVAAARATGQTATLTARVIGYAAKSASVTLAAGSSITQDFTLAANPLRLGEVVVTGAGTSTTRERLTTTINTVDSTSLKRAVQPQNLVSALAAQAPNVEVRTQSGEPGASASIKIRGASSVNGPTQPLFVVDGQPIDNQINSPNLLFSAGGIPGQNSGTVAQNRAADINPDDIESIEILKGGAAAAIYGARAASGVVLITTKRGHAGPTRMTISSTETFDRANPPDFLQRQYGQGSGGVAATCGGPDCALTRLSWGPKLAPGTPTYNHLDEIYDTGLTADNNIQFSGGNDRTTFFASGGLTNQDGFFKGPNNKENRASIRVKGTQQLGPTINLGGNLTYVDTRGKYVLKGSQTSGLELGALRTPPDFNNLPYLNTNGTQRTFRFPDASSTDALIAAPYYDNPFYTLNNGGNTGEIGRSIANANAQWTPLGWLNIKETLGADYYNDDELRGVPIAASTDKAGDVLRTTVNNLEIDHNLTAAASHTFTPNFDATLTVGQNLNSRRYRYLSAFGEGLIAETPFALQNTLSSQTGEIRSLAHVSAYFAQAEANLFNQLVVNVGVRNDGFSTFGASKRRNNFPKASAAWTFTNWLNGGDQHGLLSYGKLHVAYGETGKEPPIYAAVPTLSTTNIIGLGGFSDAIKSTINGVGGVQSNLVLANSNLRPERNRENEYGLDFALMNSRIDGSLTYYNKRSDDLILTVPVNAGETGAIFAYENGASLVNHGTEATLNLHPFTGPELAWDLGIQFGQNKGRVKSLLGTDFITYNNEGFNGAIGSSTVGFAPGVIRGSDFIRCGRGLTLPDGTAIDAQCGAENNARHALWLAPNGLPIGEAGQRVIADPNPKYTMSYSTSLKLRNTLTLSALVDMRKGGSVWNGTKGILNYFGVSKETLIRSSTDGQFGKNFLTNVYPYVAGPGAGVVAFKTPQDWQDWFTGDGGGFNGIEVQDIEDGSFVKLREIGVTYSAQQRWVKTLTGFSSADIRVAGRNLKTWTRYTGMDPEANIGGSEFLTQGLDYFISPQVRSLVLSISLNR